MAGDRVMLSNMVEKAGPVVTVGDNNKGLTQGYGSLEAGTVIIDNVYIVQGLKHNLLSISQLCDKGYGVLFENEKCQILHKKNDLHALQGVRSQYIIEGGVEYDMYSFQSFSDFKSTVLGVLEFMICTISKSKEHKRFGEVFVLNKSLRFCYNLIQRISFK